MVIRILCMGLLPPTRNNHLCQNFTVGRIYSQLLLFNKGLKYFFADGVLRTDNGNFLFTDKEKKEFIKQEPQAKKYFKPLLSSREYINGEKRWCLWLVEADPKELKKMHLVLERIEAVKKLD